VGFAAGIVILVFVYIAIRVLSIRLPLKPFFIGTSALLFIMSVSFIGNGVKELQEGNVIGVSPLPLVRSVDILGIYPTLETLVPQIILLLVSAATFVLQLKRGAKKLQSADG
jgi:high-affinity iron transporter